MMRCLIVWLLGVVAVAAAIPQVDLELLAADTQVPAGESTTVALSFTIPAEWHLYWKNPGESGLPIRVTWELPEGVEVGPLQWPAPERFEYSGIIGFGYHHRVALLADLTFSAGFEATGAEIGASVKYLVCSKEMCVPGKQSAAMSIQRGERQTAPTQERINQMRAKLPATELPWTLKVGLDDQGGLMIASSDGPAVETTAVDWFVQDEGWLDLKLPTFSQTDAGWTLHAAPASPRVNPPPATLRGVLRLGEHAYAIEQPLK